MKHIGIVACSAEGAALCYTTIVNEAGKILGEFKHPEISMHTPPLSKYMEYINKDDWINVGKLIVVSIEKLAKIGAEFAIIPDNTIHRAFEYAERHSPIPLLNIASEVLEQANQSKYKSIGVLGTKYLMESTVYSDLMKEKDMTYLIPSKIERDNINKIIFDELTSGICTEKSLEYSKIIIDKLKDAGCDAVVLGCTELPLLIKQEYSSLPVLDSTRILAKAALNYAIQ